MNYDQQFERKALDERLFLKKLLPLIYSNPELEPVFQFTPSIGRDVYDCCVCLFDKLTKSLVERHIIEIKVRDKFYSTLLLEKKKLESLKKIAEIGGSSIFYISVTPNGTFIFNLSEIESSLVFSLESHWASSTNKSTGKVTKSVTNIPIEKGIKYNVFTSDLEELRLEENKNNKVEKLVEQHKRTSILYDGVKYRGFEI